MQEAICSSLEDYNKQIEQLKDEMNDATRGADNIRNDISALTQRYAEIDRDEECGVLISLRLSSVYLYRSPLLGGQKSPTHFILLNELPGL